jgi:hypothetical protein
VHEDVAQQYHENVERVCLLRTLMGVRFKPELKESGVRNANLGQIPKAKNEGPNSVCNPFAALHLSNSFNLAVVHSKSHTRFVRIEFTLAVQGSNKIVSRPWRERKSLCQCPNNIRLCRKTRRRG